MKRWWPELRPFLPLVAMLAVYALARIVYTAVAGSAGLLTPSGALHERAAILGIAVLVLRLVALVVVPGLAVYKLVMRLARRWTE